MSSMNESTPYATVPSSVLTWIMLILPISLALTSLLINSLENLPLSRQCLIVRMYGDSFRVNLLLVLFWGFSSVIWSIFEAMDDASKHKTAQIIAFLDQLLSLLLVLNLCSIGIFRILRVRYKILDPLSIWVDDESQGFGIIRGFIIVVALLANICFYISFSIPPVYYMIKDGDLNSAPAGSIVILTFDITILIFCGFIHITATILHKYQEFQFAKRYEYREQDGTGTKKNVNILKCLVQCQNNDSDPISICGVVICFIINALVIIFGCIFIYHLQPFFSSESRKSSFWVIIVFFIGNQGVIIPIAVIFKYASLKVSILRSLRNFIDILYNQLKLKCIFLCRYRRSTRVQNQPNDIV